MNIRQNSNVWNKINPTNSDGFLVLLQLSKTENTFENIVISEDVDVVNR